MLENNKYNLGRDYEFYATTPPSLEKQGRDCNCNLESHNTQETKYKNNHPGSSSEGLPNRKGKEDSKFYISTPIRSNNRGRYERKKHIAASSKS